MTVGTSPAFKDKVDTSGRTILPELKVGIQAPIEIVSFGNVLIYRETKPATETSATPSEVDNNSNPDAERLLSEVKGSILEVDGTTVVVELSGAQVNFPATMFVGKDFVSFGQPITYVIKQRIDGTRYQDFLPRKKDSNVDLKSEISALFDGE
jgi:hypothetical protein